MLMEKLIARLESAAGPDRGLDAAIAKVCHPTDDPRMAAFESGRDYPDTYTASLDAALTLVPKNWHWSVSGEWKWKRNSYKRTNRKWLKDFGHSYQVMCASEYGEPYAETYGPGYEKQPIGSPEYRALCTGGIGVNPAIALCIAALKARSNSAGTP